MPALCLTPRCPADEARAHVRRECQRRGRAWGRNDYVRGLCENAGLLGPGLLLGRDTLLGAPVPPFAQIPFGSCGYRRRKCGGAE